ncbi:hypothetical protein GCM10022402_35590 [Salinactinospora qingdaonensis]|uniref:LysR substrate-binding domain-containing protein n=1 Tax=Salinactinospora qingdaonensis TaxID=702744 RepID=A0ABP7G2G2_9ACTN
MCYDAPTEALTWGETGVRAHWSHGRREQAPPRLQLCPTPSRRQLELLRHGELNLAVVRLPAEQGAMVAATVWDEPLGILLRSQHTLAGLETLTWEDLVEQPLLWCEARQAPATASSRILAIPDAIAGSPPLGQQSRGTGRCAPTTFPSRPLLSRHPAYDRETRYPTWRPDRIASLPSRKGLGGHLHPVRRTWLVSAIGSGPQPCSEIRR